ncbi:hypothetical protein CBR_g78795 [Chara braunii]|uniref:PH domain-containing protein n=1 Tax=Chara braunii TaxID=69332 RepID=A0A388KAH1_CHABU|nr:hypothetical protein CBR_g78795 [Chara braunii]|eukprot:GBG67016.1 hypothetical protein CBR_g78795 [Chara braunii]
MLKTAISRSEDAQAAREYLVFGPRGIQDENLLWSRHRLSGWLNVKSSGSIGKWKLRLFVLQSNYMFYFKPNQSLLPAALGKMKSCGKCFPNALDAAGPSQPRRSQPETEILDRKSPPRGLIALAGCTVEIRKESSGAAENQKQYVFIIRLSEQYASVAKQDQFLLAADSPAHRDEWMEYIRKAAVTVTQLSGQIKLMEERIAERRAEVHRQKIENSDNKNSAQIAALRKEMVDLAQQVTQAKVKSKEAWGQTDQLEGEVRRAAATWAILNEYLSDSRSKSTVSDAIEAIRKEVELARELGDLLDQKLGFLLGKDLEQLSKEARVGLNQVLSNSLSALLQRKAQWQVRIRTLSASMHKGQGVLATTSGGPSSTSPTASPTASPESKAGNDTNPKFIQTPTPRSPRGEQGIVLAVLDNTGKSISSAMAAILQGLQAGTDTTGAVESPQGNLQAQPSISSITSSSSYHGPPLLSDQSTEELNMVSSSGSAAEMSLSAERSAAVQQRDVEDPLSPHDGATASSDAAAAEATGASPPHTDPSSSTALALPTSNLLTPQSEGVPSMLDGTVKPVDANAPPYTDVFYNSDFYGLSADGGDTESTQRSHQGNKTPATEGEPGGLQLAVPLRSISRGLISDNSTDSTRQELAVTSTQNKTESSSHDTRNPLPHEKGDERQPLTSGRSMSSTAKQRNASSTTQPIIEVSEFSGSLREKGGIQIRLSVSRNLSAFPVVHLVKNPSEDHSRGRSRSHKSASISLKAGKAGSEQKKSESGRSAEQLALPADRQHSKPPNSSASAKGDSELVASSLPVDLHQGHEAANSPTQVRGSAGKRKKSETKKHTQTDADGNGTQELTTIGKKEKTKHTYSSSNKDEPAPPLPSDRHQSHGDATTSSPHQTRTSSLRKKSGLRTRGQERVDGESDVIASPAERKQSMRKRTSASAKTEELGVALPAERRQSHQDGSLRPNQSKKSKSQITLQHLDANAIRAPPSDQNPKPKRASSSVGREDDGRPLPAAHSQSEENARNSSVQVLNAQSASRRISKKSEQKKTTGEGTILVSLAGGKQSKSKKVSQSVTGEDRVLPMPAGSDPRHEDEALSSQQIPHIKANQRKKADVKQSAQHFVDENPPLASVIDPTKKKKKPKSRPSSAPRAGEVGVPTSPADPHKTRKQTTFSSLPVARSAGELKKSSLHVDDETLQLSAADKQQRSKSKGRSALARVEEPAVRFSVGHDQGRKISRISLLKPQSK